MRRVDDARSALMWAAKRRSTVTWGTGVTGTLLHVGPRSDFARVKVGNRHVNVPVENVLVVES